MGFWDDLRKATSELAGELGANYVAGQEADRLLGLGRSLARRELKRASEDADPEQWQRLVDRLDQIAREDDGERSEFAADLAEYAEGLV